MHSFLAMLVSTGTYGHIVANLASFELVHDGVGEGQKPVFVAFKQLASLDRYCNHGYGFMLCTTTVLGNIFLVLVYGCLMLFAGKFLNEGSEFFYLCSAHFWVFLPLLSSLLDAFISIGMHPFHISTTFWICNFKKYNLFIFCTSSVLKFRDLRQWQDLSTHLDFNIFSHFLQ